MTPKPAWQHGSSQPFNQEYDPATDTRRDLAPMPRGHPTR